MAARRLVEPTRIGVLVPPSFFASAWIDAITSAARERGWLSDVFLDRLPADWASAPRVVLVTEAWPDLLSFEPTHLAVLVPAVDDAVGHAKWGDSVIERLRHVSHRLSEASVAVQRADLVVEASAATIDLFDLGPVSSGQTGRPDAGPVGADAPLNLFCSLPPKVGASAVWPLDLFTMPTATLTPEGALRMDITGRSRVLIYGPYIELPPGVWEVTFTFAVSSTNSVPFRFEWGSPHGEVIVSEKVSVSGIYEIALRRTWDAIEPAEIRIYLDHAIFDGQFDVIACRVARVG